MKSIYLIGFLALFISCTNVNEPTFDDSLLEGEWNWDSSNVEKEWFKEWVFFDSENNYYKYTYWNDSYLVEEGKLEQGKIYLNNTEKYTIDTLSLTEIKMTEPDGTCHFYIKSDYSWSEKYSYQQELKEWFEKDSLKTLIVGKWKLIKAKYPIELMNSPEVLTEFTLEFSRDNSAAFYKNHDPDSAIGYTYKVRPDGIELERGCIVGSESLIPEVNDSVMLLVFDPKYWKDTLILHRIP